MAKTVSLSVRVDDTQFKQFMVQYNAFAAQIKGLNASFTQIQNTIQKTTQQTTVLSATMKVLLTGTRSFANLIKSVTGEFFKWSTLIGGISALLGMGGGLFGIERLAASIMQKRKQVLGLGGTYGGVQAANIFGQSMLDNPQQVLQGIRMGTGGAPDQMRALSALGVPFGTQKKPEELLPEIMTKVQKLMQGAAPGTELAVGQAYGLSSLGFSASDLIRLKTMTQEDLKKEIEKMQKARDEMSMSDKAQKAWSDLEIQFKAAKTQLMSTFGEKLADLAKPLTELSDSFVKLVKVLMDTGLVEEVIKQLVKWLTQLSDYLKGDTVKDDLQKFVKEIKGWAPTLKEFKEKLETFATVLGNIIDVMGKLWRFITGKGEDPADVLRRIQEHQRNQGGPTVLPPNNTTTTPPAPSTVPYAVPTPNFVPGQVPPLAPPSPSSTPATPGKGGSLSIGGSQFASTVTGGSRGGPQFTSFTGGSRGGNGFSFMGDNNAFAMMRGGDTRISARGGNQNRLAMWSGAAQRAAPGDNITGMAFNNRSSFAFAGNRGQGGGGGPLDSNNWQMSRTASLTIRNVPGSNIYAHSNVMSG